MLERAPIPFSGGTFRAQGLNPRLLRLLRQQLGSLPPGNPDLFKALAESASQGHCNKCHRLHAFILSHPPGRNQGSVWAGPIPQGLGYLSPPLRGLC